MASLINRAQLSSLFLFTIVLGVTLVSFAGFAESPRDMGRFDYASKPAARDWGSLKIRDDEIQLLEKIAERSDFEAFHIAYKSDALHITGVLARPRLEPGKRYPLVMTNHGAVYGVNGPYRAIAIEFARRGYVALASTYRGEQNTEGLSEGRVEIAKGEVADVLQLMRLGKKLPYVDSERVGMMGGSHGGTITIQAIERDSSIMGVVAGVPMIVSSSREHDRGSRASMRRLFTTHLKVQLSDDELDTEMKARDMYVALDKIRTPLLILTTDTDIGYEGQKHFVEMLKQHGIEHRFRVYPGLFHAFMTATWEGIAARKTEAGARAPEGGSKALAVFAQPEKRATLDRSRDEAWREAFEFMDMYVRRQRR